jgi:pimeloyl-ACP methyl ester carboxylesterase
MPFVNRNGIQIHYQTHGTGTPFLFFSETACAGDIWNTFQVPEFCRDHRVITYDYRGTKKSGTPATQHGCGAEYRYPAMPRGSVNSRTPMALTRLHRAGRCA